MAAGGLTFQLQLQGLTSLKITQRSVLRGKLETLRNTLDSGISSCISAGQQPTLLQLVDDLRNFQEQWDIDGLCEVDRAAQSCTVTLDAVKDTAHQMMLTNKVNARLKNFASFEEKRQKEAGAVAPLPLKPPKDNARKKMQEMMAKFVRLPPPPPQSDSDSSDTSDKDVRRPRQEELRKTFYLGDSIQEAEPADAKQPARFEYSDSLEEFIQTERSYLRRVCLVWDHYYQNLLAGLQHTSSGKSIADKMRNEFADFGTFKNLHQQLLNDLEAMRAAAGSDVQKFRIGHTMQTYAPHLRLYNDFFAKYKDISKTVNDWMKDEQFRSLCTKLRSECPNKEDQMLEITMHMLEPIQRPMRYPLLMEKYIKEITASHPDHEAAQTSLQLIKDVTGGLNERVRELESFQKLLIVLREVTFPASLTQAKDNFVRTRFLRQAQVVKISSRNILQLRYLYLSDKFLLFCYEKRVSKHVQQVIDLKQVEVTLDEKLSADYPNCFRLHTPKKSYDLSFATSSEFDNWLAELKGLGVCFSASERNDRFPWLGLTDSEFGTKAPMWLKDMDASQCQACSRSFNTIIRRHHCRLCGGLFCKNCSNYNHHIPFENSNQRVCFFCKDRAGRRDGQTTIIQLEHRSLIEKFNKKELNLRAPVAQGYLDVKVDIHEAKKSQAPASLSEWTKVWCTADDQDFVFCAYKMKKDFNYLYQIVLPLMVTVQWAPSSDLELLLHVEKLETCHLRLTEESGVRSADAEASRLQDWYDILKRLSLNLEQPQQPEQPQPQLEQPQLEQPQLEQPQLEQPQLEQPQLEQPQTEQPQTEQPETEQPETEQPQTEQRQPEQ